MAAEQIIHRKEHAWDQACNVAISVAAKELGADLIIEILSELVSAKKIDMTLFPVVQ